MSVDLNNLKFYGEFAETTKDITADEWAYIIFNDDISDQIYSYMNENNITKSQLAGLLNTSKAYVSKVLSGDANMTFKTFTKILDVMGAKAVTKIISKDSSSCWDSNCWIKFKDSARISGSLEISTPKKKNKARYFDEQLPFCWNNTDELVA